LSGCWVTSVSGAGIAVITVVVRIGTASSSNSDIASLVSARVVIFTRRWANTSFTTRAETLATSTTRVARNVNTCHDDKLVDNASQL